MGWEARAVADKPQKTARCTILAAVVYTYAIMDSVNAMFVGMTFAFVGAPLLFKAIGVSRLPKSVVQLYAYGKITGGARPTGLLSVPKRWYRHFYATSVVLVSLAALAMADAYLHGPPWPAAAWSRRWLWDPIRRPEPSYSAAAAAVAVTMAVLQCLRRAYETHFVNEFSNTAVGLWYYASGYMHYAGMITTVMVEAPATPGPPFFTGGFAEVARLTAGALLFAWAFREQWRANVALASARKTNGRVTTYEHLVITGGLFELVSSPQMFTEMVLYGAWYVVLWGSTGWKYVLLFVWGNQLEIALISHRWYQDKFKDYPRNRKAIIPYLL